MEVGYIIAIVLGCVFAAMLLTFIILYARARKRDNERNEQLEKMYCDPNLKKMEYDFGAYGEDIEAYKHGGDGERNASDDDQQLSFLNPVENEGMEEITGNYKP